MAVRVSRKKSGDDGEGRAKEAHAAPQETEVQPQLPTGTAKPGRQVTVRRPHRGKGQAPRGRQQQAEQGLPGMPDIVPELTEAAQEAAHPLPVGGSLKDEYAGRQMSLNDLSQMTVEKLAQLAQQFSVENISNK